jgi:hypothetical protein
VNIYFSDFFNISKEVIDEYGAFNISLINDLPVFIDPFLLFNSDRVEYQQLHEKIILYISFLREMSDNGKISDGLLKHWFLFPEVKQNWLGYSKIGNSGSGLGQKFATALNENLGSIFRNFGNEQITKGSHLEKLCLIKDGVGKDSISDFTTNLVKGFLCEYTQEFARKNIHADKLKEVNVSHSEFSYKTRRWLHSRYNLPYVDGDYVILTPKDILTKDEAWINKYDIIGDFDEIVSAIPNMELRGQINDYLLRQIPERASQRDVSQAISRTLLKFPALIDHYIRFKEDRGDQAVALSEEKIKETEAIFIRQVTNLVEVLRTQNLFYTKKGDTFEEAYLRIKYLKEIIECNDGYRLFYVKGEPVKRESDLQLIFRLTWYASEDDVNAEVNNGRGPVDYKISRGSKDKTLVEFKLASNSKLRQNLENQVEVYEAANQTNKSIKVILFFTDSELEKTIKIIKALKLNEGKSLVLIDARATNKPSGSNA